ncbi:MAG: hypothetical protein AAFQ10_05595 [Pseudomonadota bacterium]
METQGSKKTLLKKLKSSAGKFFSLAGSFLRFSTNENSVTLASEESEPQKDIQNEIIMLENKCKENGKTDFISLLMDLEATRGIYKSYPRAFESKVKSLFQEFSFLSENNDIFDIIQQNTLIPQDINILTELIRLGFTHAEQYSERAFVPVVFIHAIEKPPCKISINLENSVINSSSFNLSILGNSACFGNQNSVTVNFGSEISEHSWQFEAEHKFSFIDYIHRSGEVITTYTLSPTGNVRSDTPDLLEKPQTANMSEFEDSYEVAGENDSFKLLKIKKGSSAKFSFILNITPLQINFIANSINTTEISLKYHLPKGYKYSWFSEKRDSHKIYFKADKI